MVHRALLALQRPRSRSGRYRTARSVPRRLCIDRQAPHFARGARLLASDGAPALGCHRAPASATAHGRRRAFARARAHRSHRARARIRGAAVDRTEPAMRDISDAADLMLTARETLMRELLPVLPAQHKYS